MGVALIHSSSASLMDHGSSQEHTKTDRAPSLPYPASPFESSPCKNYFNRKMFFESFHKTINLIAFESKEKMRARDDVYSSFPGFNHSRDHTNDIYLIHNSIVHC